MWYLKTACLLAACTCAFMAALNAYVGHLAEFLDIGYTDQGKVQTFAYLTLLYVVLTIILHAWHRGVPALVPSIPSWRTVFDTLMTAAIALALVGAAISIARHQTAPSVSDDLFVIFGALVAVFALVAAAIAGITIGYLRRRSRTPQPI